jgi:predicted amidohydrolase
MKDIFRIGVVQMTSTDDIRKNLATVIERYREGIRLGAEMVVFPENSLFHKIRQGSAVESLDLNGEVHRLLIEEVNKAGVPLMLTTPVLAGSAKPLNATVLYREGRGQVVYSKIHLFDVDVVGAPSVRESDSFQSGAAPEIVEIEGFRFGLSICYDLRFSELYSNYSQKVDVILVPAAFLVPTGEAHWQVLLRARAIESQCFVVAPAQGGVHQSNTALEQTRSTYGHSMVVDPWGRVLYENQGGPGVHVVELRRPLVDQVRRQIPMSGHRKLSRG